MNYIVLIEAKECEPISTETLIQWVEDGRVLPGMQVRNSMMNNWHKAVEYDFLADAFMKQKAAFEQNSLEINYNEKESLKDMGKAKDEEGFTAFKNSYMPDPAPINLRILATLFDYILIGGVIVCFFVIASFAGMSFDINMTQTLTPSFYLLIFIFFILWLTYFVVCFGGFAQTFGMWFWGILLVRNGDEAGPVYWGRAFLYTVFMLFFGIFSPFILFILGRGRALHDIFSGIQVVRISARPK